MHDKPDSELNSATTSTPELIAGLVAADPADAPDLAEAIAERLEAGLAPAAAAEVAST